MAEQKNIRTMKMSTGDGKDVQDTTMLKGEAKDSLSGKNTTTQYTTGGAGEGKLGGMNTNS